MYIALYALCLYLCVEEQVSYKAEVIADSIYRQSRITTIQCTFPRIMLCDFNTHRVLSKNSASSRAIPATRKIADVRANPFVPDFANNKAGMKAGEPLTEEEQRLAKLDWLESAELACKQAEKLVVRNVHKQWVNALVDPFTWQTVICTGTEWENFFALRAHPDARPEFEIIAKMMKAAMEASTPQKLSRGEWHLPYTYPEERLNVTQDVILAACGRIARVSYETHNGKRDIQADIKLANTLRIDGHMSPFEHIAQVASADMLASKNPSNFRAPWLQFRKTLKNEDVFRGK